MQTTHILIDCENVSPSSLSLANIEGVFVYVFLGPNNSKLGTKFAIAIHEYGERAKYIELGKSGKNALDFHIAFYLGKLACLYPSARFRVISRDKEFGTLIDHLNMEKVDADCVESIEQAIDANFVKRSGQFPIPLQPPTVKVPTQSAVAKTTAKPTAKPVAIAAAKSKPKAKSEKNYGGMKTKELAVLAWEKLTKRKKAKPSKVNKLNSTLKADFSGQLDEKKLKAVVQQLIKDGHVEIEGETVGYK